ncbi:uncharacterized protein LOC123670324 [Melitaea cinxia]|uniref:uncharacterized protein LOC123670324 n=1 Tax=Melitaea cinxia TaxID=113334 RepID=UPI001E2722F7|nr:uncharacterized protein LOC123670324 [Melitaea cinxia]
MFRIILAITIATLCVSAIPKNLPHPQEFAFTLGEEEFEDYLDKWLEIEEQNWINSTLAAETRNSRCTFRVNGDFRRPHPVFIHRSRNTFLAPTGNSGQVRLNGNEEIIVSCPGSNRSIRHPNIISTVHTANARCVNNAVISGAGWLNGNRNFRDLTCSSHPYYIAERTNQRCFNNNIVIRVGFNINNVFHTIYRSCYNQNRMEVLYVWHDQNPTNAVHQTGVPRPSWLAGNFFPGVNINTAYTQNSQRTVIGNLVGSNIVGRYITNTQFLTRGHLTAKSDHVFEPNQRSTFFFINAAPQWQPFNAGNWNNLEQNLRRRIAAAGYNAVLYTGTFGVTQLRNSNNRLVDIYLASNNRVPVPQYFYKVAYDASRRRGTAFISINNPYYTLAEARRLQFCTDRCRNNNAFNWINWQPDRVDIGYSFCCTIADFRRRIGHIPNFDASGGLLS